MAVNHHIAVAPGKHGTLMFALSFLALVFGIEPAAAAAPASTSASAGVAGNAAQKASPAPPQTLEIDEYTVLGNHILTEEEVDDAVYPYLGPGQTVASVDAARAALQKAYTDKGYETVAVEIPPQHVVNGVVILKVVEGKVGRLNVNGSRYFSLNEIKKEAPSLAPGTVPNFKAVTHDIVALNSWPDRQVTPVLQTGSTPGTVDVNLNVKDTLPLHGSLGLNNFYSPDTTPLRLNGALSYDNLWQRGDAISFNFQLAPQDLNDAEVFEGSYQARIPGVNWASLLVYGLDSNSDVSSVGGSDVIGKGQVIGTRGIFTLPSGPGFFDSLSAGIDYKNFNQGVTFGGVTVPSPVTYYPLTATYSATWQGTSGTTQFDIGPTFSLRGLGSNTAEFDNRRYDAQSNFIYVKGDLSRTQELPDGYELFGKMQGQIANEPLVNTEQFAGGGQDTVRGYLEAEVLGDNAIIGSVEIRTPSLAHFVPSSFASKIDDWRIYAWGEGGQLSILDALPEQQSVFDLASIGVGTRIKLFNHLNGMVELALPLVSSVVTKADSPRIQFSVWVEF